MKVSKKKMKMKDSSKKERGGDLKHFFPLLLGLIEIFRPTASTYEFHGSSIEGTKI